MISSIQTVDDFKYNFDFAYKALAFVDEIDTGKRARFQFISQISKAKYRIFFRTITFLVTKTTA